VFWVISVYFNIRNTLPTFDTFLLGHSIYIYICIYIYIFACVFVCMCVAYDGTIINILYPCTRTMHLNIPQLPISHFYKCPKHFISICPMIYDKCCQLKHTYTQEIRNLLYRNILRLILIKYILIYFFTVLIRSRLL
jgi:hypothetical protein